MDNSADDLYQFINRSKKLEKLLAEVIDDSVELNGLAEQLNYFFNVFDISDTDKKNLQKFRLIRNKYTHDENYSMPSNELKLVLENFDDSFSKISKLVDKNRQSDQDLEDKIEKLLLQANTNDARKNSPSDDVYIAKNRELDITLEKLKTGAVISVIAIATFLKIKDFFR